MEATNNKRFIKAQVTDLSLSNLRERGLQFCAISSHLANQLGIEPRDVDCLLNVRSNVAETILRMTIFRKEQDVVALDDIVMMGIDASIEQFVNVRKMNDEEVVIPPFINAKVFSVKNNSEQIDIEDLDGFVQEIQDDLRERLSDLTFANGNFYECTIGDIRVEMVITTKVPYFRIGRETQINFTIQRSNIDTIDWKDIGGLKKEIEQVRERVELPIKYPELFQRINLKAAKGILLYGPSGTGKTLIAKAQAGAMGLYSVFIDGSGILSKYYGESEENLQSYFIEALENKPSIIFIDELDALTPKRGADSGSLESRVVAKLLTLMDGIHNSDGVTIIGATNRIDAVDSALRRPGRFDIEIEIGVPDEEGRAEILDIHLRDTPLKDDVDIKELASMTHGFVGADLYGVIRKGKYKAIRKLVPDIDEEVEITEDMLENLVLTQEDIREAIRETTPSALREFLVEVPDVRWTEIGGLEEEIMLIKESVTLPLQKPELFKKLGVKPPTGILLYGPPGCGKTLIAKAVATESGSNFISVKGPELFSKWVGESEKAVRSLFAKARQVAPCVIFFDEIDAIGRSRGVITTDAGVSDKVMAQLLTEMDGVEKNEDIVIVMATNRPDQLDPALMRSGRVDRFILVRPPNKTARVSIFEIHTSGMKLCKEITKKEFLEKLAEETEGYSGSDIELLCREAGMNAIRRENVKCISKKDFENAIEQSGASISNEMINFYEEMKNKLRSRKRVSESPWDGYT